MDDGLSEGSLEVVEKIKESGGFVVGIFYVEFQGFLCVLRMGERERGEGREIFAEGLGWDFYVFF